MGGETVTERELLDRARAGDENAFAQLVRDNEKKIYHLALRMTGNPEDAMDLSQEAFLNAWRGLKFFKGDSAFSTWLYRLASNACIDFLRRERRRQDVTVPMPEREEGERVELPDPGPGPEEALERQERRRALEEGMAQLSDKHRQVLLLRESGGLSYQEIAQTLDMEVGTVKSSIARARMALRKILLENGNFFDSPSSNEIDEKKGG